MTLEKEIEIALPNFVLENKVFLSIQTIPEATEILNQEPVVQSAQRLEPSIV